MDGPFGSPLHGMNISENMMVHDGIPDVDMVDPGEGSSAGSVLGYSEGLGVPPTMTWHGQAVEEDILRDLGYPSWLSEVLEIEHVEPEKPKEQIDEVNTAEDTEEDTEEDIENDTEDNTEDDTEDSKEVGNPFHVDTSLIPQSNLGLGDQASELQDLGLNVFNQDDFEQGVMAQVDQRLEKEEEHRLHNIFSKEMAGIDEDIKLVEQELTRLKDFKVGGNITTDRNALNQLRSIMQQRENKQRQLKRLHARKKALLEKKAAAERGEDGGLLGHRKETEHERMIRLGEMTPFGTRMSGSGASTSTRAAQPRPGSSAGDEGSTSTGTRRKSKSRKSQDSEISSRIAEAKRVMERRNSLLRGETVYKETGDEDDSQISEEEEEAGSDEEYLPSKEELRSYRREERGSVEKVSKRRKRRSSLAQVPSCKSPQSPRHGHIKRDRSVRKEKDDADEVAYNKRLRLLQTNESKDKPESEESDEEFEGGLHVPAALWKKLYGYQRTGVRWLWELHQQDVGGIMGDEMGLGKTIQVIGLLAALRHSRVRDNNFTQYLGLGPVIVVCPATVMHQWVKEFHTWYPKFRVAILHSSGSFTTSESQLVHSIVRSRGVLVTSYSTLVSRQEIVLPYDWHYVVLDEGHKIRNPNAQITLACKRLRTPHRLILSGSPIQNNLNELWSLFDFIYPGKLGTLTEFQKAFAVPIVRGGYTNASQVEVETARRCAEVLRDTINPYLLRRMKADVQEIINLPKKNEQVLFCRLTEEQQEVYREYLGSRECQAILSGKAQIFPGLMTLRKISNHPDISTGGPKVWDDRELEADKTLEYGYWERSGKMVVINSLLHLWKKQGHRVLLFSQSRHMLNIIEKFVEKKGYTYLRMDGTTNVSGRQPLVAQYNSDPSIFLFLLTTRVGGLGVNLTGANRIIIFDPDWNPSTDMQARERAWRIGQQRQVTIYRLLTAGTIEEKIYHKQIFKQCLTNRVLKDPKQRRLLPSSDIFELFKLSSYDKDEDTMSSALFAGTGAEITRAKLKKRLNRFDAREEAKPVQPKPKPKPVKSKADPTPAAFPTTVEKMREMARMLSRRMEEEKRKREMGESGTSDGKGPDSEGENHESPPCKKQRLDSSKRSSSSEHRHHKSDEHGGSSGSGHKKSHAEKHGSSKRHSKDGSQKSESERRRSSEHGHHGSRGERRGSSEKRHHGSEGEKGSSSKHGQSKSEKSEGREEEAGRHHHHRKRRRDAKFEGERIPHLVKTDVYVPHEEEESKQARAASQDEYVLSQLFKKSGVHSALRHDKVVDGGYSDHTLVISEAEKVAKAAVAALKRSRAHCPSALSGIPTWTGQQGGTSGAPKPRFGNKKNNMLVQAMPKAPEKPKEEKPAEEKHFDGTEAGVSSSISAGVMSSQDLLARMHQRQLLSGEMDVYEEIEEEEGEPGLFTALCQARKAHLNPDDMELLTDMRNFIAFQSKANGEASTRELIAYFGLRVQGAREVKFRAMLKQICDFVKVNGKGIWKLKFDFR